MIHNGLGQERKDQLQDTADQQAHHQLTNLLFVGFHVREHEAQPLRFTSVFFCRFERRCWFNQQNNAQFNAILSATDPALLDL